MVQLYHLLYVLRVVELIGHLANQILGQVTQNTCYPVCIRVQTQRDKVNYGSPSDIRKCTVHTVVALF